jgi:preprotein translocase subunit SecE
VTELHDESSAVPERDLATRPAGTVRRERGGLPARTSLYFRQVVAELRKVIWPSRTELRHYTAVVIVFVLVMIALLALLDYAFGRLMFWMFG